MADLVIKEKVWQELAQVARRRRKKPEDLVHTALMEFLERHGNPAESSERVRSAARVSMNKLLSSGVSAGGVDFFPVTANHQTPVPATTSPAPATSWATQRERDIAATVSIQPKTAAVPPSRPTLYDYLRNFFYGRDAAIDPRCAA